MKVNEYEKRHISLLRRDAGECMVLLKTNGDFPLEKAGELALYGNGARNTIKGGTGSGEVNSRYFLTIEQGLEAAGFTITTKSWLDAYEGIRTEAHKDFVKEIKKQAKKKHTMAVIEGMGAVMPEPSYELPLSGAGETAVYVLSRISGEGADRKFVDGDILLSETEKRDILFLKEKYKKFMLVLNVGGPVDLSPVLSVENILLLSQLGVVTADALADVLLGKANPSGKLTTTWSGWEDYCSFGEFGDINDTRYREGIYVGYRYFDTVGKKALFPFGYGLSYTKFRIVPGNISADGEQITVHVSVKNAGGYAGKEVVQLYVSLPEGKLDQPYQVLAAWAKTRKLESGEAELLSLQFALSELASYDTETAAYILEKGTYALRMGSSSTDTVLCGAVRLDKDTVTLQARTCLGTPDFTDWKFGARDDLFLDEGIQIVKVSGKDIPGKTVQYDRKQETDPKIEHLSAQQLAYMNVGAFDPRGSSLSIIGNASTHVAGAAGETTSQMEFLGIPPLVMADGPAGLRLSRKYIKDGKGVHAIEEALPQSIREFLPAPAAWIMGHSGRKVKKGSTVYEQYATAIPIGTAIAQSWNLAFAEMCGDIVGDEMERFGVHLWLAPALNIHRDIRCGRNFEYFSEDPLISGRFAAAITRGVQKHPGCAVTVKHYAANNQENNRYNNNSQVSERAMREIYLKGFGICVREAGPKAVMSSYNLLNGTHTSERRDLIEDILRSEYGFEGIVMTDWIIAGGTMNKASVYPAPDAGRIAAAGGDLTMPGGKKDYQNILKALKEGRITKEQLKINATRVYRLAKELSEKQ